MKENIKQKILAAGASIIHRKGYNHTGIQEILQTVGVPKGSFYFYFKNKEDFGLQVIDYFVSFFGAQAAPVLNDNSIPPLERM
ncbi:MAG: TetR/AcrR family transcriptional regulator, partial [Deltaproteobacteria bacterium]|nr:TetR/AcrR family transcriptional regulator [Deltaproteobacteria bacterium]